jgi:RNA polymerase sigma-70 factor (ECF subfamily)
MKADLQQANLERARQGDRQALGELLESFRPYIQVLARALRRDRLPSRMDDSDLIQDALVAAHKHFAGFRGCTVAELTAWLRQIVIRTAGRLLRDHQDAGKQDLIREQLADGLIDVADPGSSPSAQAMRHEQAVRMAEALARLPQDMQQVLLGRHMDGASYAVLAERLGRSEGAVRVLYTRALRRLREECREE